MSVFVTLKNSVRNSSLLDSPNGNCFCKLRSADRRPGPRTVPTPHVPNVPGAAGPYEAGSNHWKPMKCPPGPSNAGFLPNTCGGAMQLARDPREYMPSGSTWSLPNVVQAAILSVYAWILTAQPLCQSQHLIAFQAVQQQCPIIDT